MKINQIVANNVSKLMEQNPSLGSQVKLAKKTGIGQSNISRLRRGEVSPTAETLEAVAGAFGLSAADILREDLFDQNGNIQPMMVRGTQAKESHASPHLKRLIVQLELEQPDEHTCRVLGEVLTLASCDKRPLQEQCKK